MKRIYDPIHHFIELDDGEQALVDAAPLQRLRRLRQLGLAYLAFPAAEHSRFGHAVGALALGDRVIEGLRRHSPEYFASEADFARQRRLLRAALLLHDVGHGPFSHACEAVLGVPHEARTSAILALPQIAAALQGLDLASEDVHALVTGNPEVRFPVLREIVSGPNLDADRMDYLLRDGYFTGVVSGRYDADQLIGALRVFEQCGRPVLGVDGRGTVALESFVLARYMMFSTVYFHHTTRQFERILHAALRELWPEPGALDPIEAFLEWDDFRIFDALRSAASVAGRALRERHTLFALVAEFNAERDLSTYETCRELLLERYGEAVWADEQQQAMHRLPLGAEPGPTVLVRTQTGLIDAREASDLIGRLSGSAYWRKLYVLRERADVGTARELCAAVVTRARQGKNGDDCAAQGALSTGRSMS
ncbi:MAG: HD domain-containing protein [Candidatus Eremiobacteraeota bacterium]|nr:HD domain-containing protein [Candidatus Eremiobacteraeota bacterium]MBC5802883.1 HD domain-containing protein [Candidatus Eremiobacteraeota bacterium]MBC5823946.1 HD domain-containing protein [Candidatus Eremiobacteraeota bacterium]